MVEAYPTYWQGRRHFSTPLSREGAMPEWHDVPGLASLAIQVVRLVTDSWKKRGECQCRCQCCKH